MDDALRPENAKLTAPTGPSPLAAPAFDRRRIRRWASIVALALLGAFLLLQNPYWVPGGDSDFYVTIARSMARGQGFLYNGLPVAISPPGWPWVMAKVMAISPTFLALKFTAMLSMYGSLVIGYFIALRFLKPSQAGLGTILAGLLMPVYSLTYFLHSEGAYCLLSACALLLALRLREGRGGNLHRVALVACCIAMPLVRWAGIFQLLPIGAVLMSGPRGMPWFNRHWKTAVTCCLVIIATWTTTRIVLNHMTPEMAEQVRVEGVGTTSDSEVIDEQPAQDVNAPPIFTQKDAKHGIVREMFDRLIRSGKWFAWLLWQPGRFVEFNKPAAALVTVIGWGIIGMLGFLAVHEARRGEWLWVSLALYTGAICMGWDNVNSRYFVPVAPLIIVGLLLSTRRLGAAFPTKTIDVWKWLRRGLVYSVLLCNLAMFGVDVIVMRSARFYETFEAGQHKDLIAAARFLNSLPPEPPTTEPATAPTSLPAGVVYRADDGDLLVNDRYENLGPPKNSKAGDRAMALLLDKLIKPLDGKATRVVRPPVSSPRLAKIMRQRRTEWYFAQAPAIPWRVWHFRVPEWLYTRLSKRPVTAQSGGWALYHFDRISSTFTEYPFPPVENWPTRVPGM